MKISTHVVTLLLFFSVALFAQTSEKSSSPAKHPRSAKTERCASRDPESAYSVCVSVSALDVILWYSSQGKPFKVKISHQHGGPELRIAPLSQKTVPR